MVPPLSLIQLHHAPLSWKEHGEDGCSVTSFRSRNSLGGQQQHGPPYSKLLHGLSIGRLGGSRGGTRNTEGYPEGNARWEERGTSGKGCEGITRFVSSLRDISRVLPIQQTSVFPGQDLCSGHLQSQLLDCCTFSRL